jgi:hypothetical protein
MAPRAAVAIGARNDSPTTTSARAWASLCYIVLLIVKSASRFTTAPLNTRRADVVDGRDIRSRIGVEKQQVGDTARLDASDVTPAVDIGIVTGSRGERFARRDANRA